MKKIILTFCLIMFAQVIIAQTNFDIIKTFSKSASLADMANQIKLNLRLDELTDIPERKSKLASYAFIHDNGNPILHVLIESNFQGNPTGINYLMSSDYEERFRNSIDNYKLVYSQNSQTVKNNWFNEEGNYYYQYRDQGNGTVLFIVYTE